MDFDGDFGLWQRNIAENLEGKARRMAVFEALSIESGQAILDQGCGVVTWYAIGEDDADLWLEQLSRADREGRFGFVSVPVLTTAVAV